MTSFHMRVTLASLYFRASVYQIESQTYLIAWVSQLFAKPMQRCHQEEADTKICAHVNDAFKKGARKILVSTVDTDVVVLLVSIYYQLHSAFPDLNIWVGFTISDIITSILLAKTLE